MKLSDDQKIIRLSSKLEKVASEQAIEFVGVNIFLSPEMTPIEQIVYFVLESKRLRGFIDRSIPQCVIGRYRVDFLVRKCEERNGVQEEIIIECDGHDFHEKTREQASRDKKRDRELQSFGYKIFHFTGSEIWKTDGSCVLESLGLEAD